MSSRRVIYGVAAVGLLAAGAVAFVASPASSSRGSVAAARQESAARFSIVVDGQEIASFSELAGLTSGYETEELDVDQKETILHVPASHRPASVTLKRGLTADLRLWDWYEDAIQSGSRAWKDAELVMYDVEGKPVFHFKLFHTWPSKLHVDTLDAGGRAVAMETVTLVCEHLQRVRP